MLFRFFDLINRDTAFKMNSITHQHFNDQSMLVILSPHSVYDNRGREMFTHAPYIKYVYPPWEGAEKRKFRKFVKETLLGQLESTESTVRGVAFDIENIMNREDKLPNNAVNKTWLSTDVIKTAAVDFLNTAKKGEFPDMTKDSNISLIQMILKYRCYMVGFNVRLLLDGFVDQVIDQSSKNPKFFLHRFFKVIFSDNALFTKNEKFLQTVWTYTQVPATEVVEKVFRAAKIRSHVRAKFEQMGNLGNVAQQGWTFEIATYLVLSNADYFQFTWDKNRELKLPSPLDTNDSLGQVSNMRYLKVETLYRLQSAVQPAIDMFFCTRKKLKSSADDALSIVLVQVTLAKKHKIKSDSVVRR